MWVYVLFGSTGDNVFDQQPNYSDGTPPLISWLPVPIVAWGVGANLNTDFILQIQAEWVDYNSTTSVFSLVKTIANPAPYPQRFAFVVGFS